MTKKPRKGTTNLFIVNDINKASLRKDWKKLNDQLARRATGRAIQHTHGVLERELKIPVRAPVWLHDTVIFSRIATEVEKHLVRAL